MKTIEVNKKSIQRMAKLAAGLYLLIAGLAIYTHFYVPGELIVAGDATLTAKNIAANQGFFRGGIFSELLILLSEVVLTIILYVIFKPVSKTLSLIAAVSRLTMTTIHGFNVLNSIFVLVLLSGAGYLSAFEPDELNALVMFFLDGYAYGFGLGIVFLGLHAILLGYLIYVSGYFPKVLGVLFGLASLGYFIDSFSLLLLPSYVPGQAFIAIPIALAEIAFPLWLLFKGINLEHKD
ncbi:MAG: DUF4386 domain-containing protein [Candidatus Marinimicrobia bacterium]|nr:DUF4386 domain-containing protein [Candidatus Neomarinimicrobiota bacterium]